jgi:hypothetical protein
VEICGVGDEVSFLPYLLLLSFDYLLHKLFLRFDVGVYLLEEAKCISCDGIFGPDILCF